MALKKKQNVEFISFAVQPEEKIINQNTAQKLRNWLPGNTTNHHNINMSLSF